MIAQSPDHIDKILNRIMKEAEAEMQPVIYATFLQRTIARIIDMVLVAGVTVGTAWLAFNFIRKDSPEEATYIIDGLTQALPAFGIMLWVTLYSPIMESTGGTVGKRIIGIKMVNESDAKTNVRFLTCEARTWLYLVFIILMLAPAIASCIYVLFNPKKQAFHDRLCGMICIQKK